MVANVCFRLRTADGAVEPVGVEVDDVGAEAADETVLVKVVVGEVVMGAGKDLVATTGLEKDSISWSGNQIKAKYSGQPMSF